MKDIYEILNDVDIDEEEINKMEVSDIEKAKVKKYLKKSIKKNKKWRKKNLNIKKLALVPACCAALVLCGVFTFLPGARVAAEQVLKTIFYPDKSGNIVEKSEDTEIPMYGGYIPITEENKSDIERKFGININLPEEFGEYTYLKKDDKTITPHARIKADNVKYKDIDSVLNKLTKAVYDDKVFKELSKKYKLTGYVDSKYIDNQGNQFTLSFMKKNEELKDDNEDIEQELIIDDITCKITKVTQPKYNMKEIEKGVSRTDMESKPVENIINYILNWKYDGVEYYISIGNDLSNIDAVKQFAADYIKVLEQK